MSKEVIKLLEDAHLEYHLSGNIEYVIGAINQALSLLRDKPCETCGGTRNSYRITGLQQGKMGPCPDCQLQDDIPCKHKWIIDYDDTGKVEFCEICGEAKPQDDAAEFVKKLRKVRLLFTNNVGEKPYYRCEDERMNVYVADDQLFCTIYMPDYYGEYDEEIPMALCELGETLVDAADLIERLKAENEELKGHINCPAKKPKDNIDIMKFDTKEARHYAAFVDAKTVEDQRYQLKKRLFAAIDLIERFEREKAELKRLKDFLQSKANIAKVSADNPDYCVHITIREIEQALKGGE